MEEINLGMYTYLPNLSLQRSPKSIQKQHFDSKRFHLNLRSLQLPNFATTPKQSHKKEKLFNNFTNKMSEIIFLFFT